MGKQENKKLGKWKLETKEIKYLNKTKEKFECICTEANFLAPKSYMHDVDFFDYEVYDENIFIKLETYNEKETRSMKAKGQPQNKLEKENYEANKVIKNKPKFIKFAKKE